MHRIDRIRNRRIIRLSIQFFAWVSVALLYYFGFSLLFDTPSEHRMRLSTDKLRDEYEVMSQRYDSLEMILENITARDQSVFRSLFESNPYDMESEQSEERLALYEHNITKSKRHLATDLKSEIDIMAGKASDLEASWLRIKELGVSLIGRGIALAGGHAVGSSSTGRERQQQQGGEQESEEAFHAFISLSLLYLTGTGSSSLIFDHLTGFHTMKR